jgi:zinc and cadmium transporter
LGYIYKLSPFFSMPLLYNLLLLVITILGGSIPFFIKGLNDRNMQNILAFSGSFLLSITLLHLLPETFEEIGGKAGIFLLFGFFIQLLIQRFTHGVEHGHVHLPADDHHHHHTPLASVLAGLCVHAFMEGLPLGYNYRLDATGPSLYFAVAAHKLPEAMLVTVLVAQLRSRQKALITLLLFAAITPASSMLAITLGKNYAAMSQLIGVLIPIVAGAFIHISTTIFYESGTKQHMLTLPKIVSILLGVSLALVTLLIE